MKYLVLVYGNEQIWGDLSVDFAALVSEVDAFNAALRASGEMVAVEGLVTSPRAVRNSGGVPVVTDGPYLEAKEHVGSYFLFDVRTRRGRWSSPGTTPACGTAPGAASRCGR